jgi:hypothetical protein
VQGITPSGGVWTFTTANPAYPTAYVNGEIYCFKPLANSAGGDQFQVNALGAKPIWKRVTAGPTGFIPIITQDMITGQTAQLMYNNALNAGVGAFALINPFVPVNADGSGGVSIPGSLAVGGVLSATGYKSRSGIAGPYQANNFNIQWDGAQAHLWIDNTDTGPIVVTGSGGQANITTGGVVQGENLRSIGDSYVGGNLYVQAGEVQAENLRSIGDSYVGGSLYVTGNASAVSFIQTSDASVKADIASVPAGCLDLVRAIDPRTYRFAKLPAAEADRVHWGFIASEVGGIMNQAGRKFDAVYEENGISSLAYNELIAVLWKAVQELAEKLTGYLDDRC